MAEEKNEKKSIGITVKKEQDFSEWYNQVVACAELADYAPVHGFMVIRPNGYAIWQKIMDFFNPIIEKQGVRNAYFPLLIPESFFKKEQEHAEGFSPEVAWVMQKDEGGERLAIRPTSETIMYDSYSKWIRSWRDLPLRINQWCNIVRWEIKMTKLFLRTREFLWQEGHCVYETKEECDKEVHQYLEDYKRLCEELLAIPVIAGLKTEKEKFAGALYTATAETLMPDGKALQMGTSHNLGQGFAKGFGINFLGKGGKQELPWQNSWGFSTRLIGALIMVHGDNKGLVLPPRVAEHKIAIVPIIFDKDKEKVLKKAADLKKKLAAFNPILDDREEYTAGYKFNDWESKGIPLRVEVGPKDIAKKQVVVVQRHSGKKEFIKEKDLAKKLPKILETMQAELFEKAKVLLRANIVEAKSYDELKKAISDRKLVLAPFCGAVDCEDNIKADTTATSRCFPFDQKESSMNCVRCGNPATKKSFFAKNY